MQYFKTIFLEEVNEFIAKLDRKAAKKVFFNADLAEQTSNPKLLKKLKGEIWEFRTKHSGNEIRLLAFWDKEDAMQTLVIATHGFIKKTDKVPAKEIEHAENIRKKYFENKRKK